MLRLALATKTRPPTTVGCALAVKVLGKAKAQRSFRLTTPAAVSPADAAGWKRVFAGSAPHPFHAGPTVENAGVEAQAPARAVADFVPRNSATATFSAAESGAPCSFISPDSSDRTMLTED